MRKVMQYIITYGSGLFVLIVLFKKSIDNIEGEILAGELTGWAIGGEIFYHIFLSALLAGLVLWFWGWLFFGWSDETTS